MVKRELELIGIGFQPALLARIKRV